MDKARSAIVQEARELLQAMEQALARVPAEGDDPDSVNELFRAVHTIKGSAGLLAFERIVSFTHLLESMLECVRSYNLELDPPLLSLLEDCGDYIAELVDAIAAHREHVEPDAGKRARLERALQEVLDARQARPAGRTAPWLPGYVAAGPVPESGPETRRPPRAGAEDLAETGCGDAASDLHPGVRHWRIDMSFAPDVLRRGMDPIEFLHSLASLGTLLDVRTHADDLPPAARMDAESCYLRFTLLLCADCERQAIDDVFEFVRDDSCIVVEPLPPGAAASAHGTSHRHAPAGVSAGDSVAAHAGGLPTAADAAAGSRGIGQNIEKHGGKAGPAQDYVRIPVDRLDALIDLVGELVISGAAANQVARRQDNPAFLEAAQTMEALVAQIRDAALTLRMIPIGDVFQRFPRVVRGAARQLGKEISLTMKGAETELDKSMMEKLSEPLMHIVRNAIDHGLEAAPERLAAGKPPAGSLNLAAYQDSGSIVIEVSDDGRGLDYERIRSKAVERGLLGADETLSHDDACRLLFEPGFSTTERVTRLSGRGVGMDVVRKRIESLRGETEIISRPGAGTLVRLRLPLTLAIIDGFLVVVGDTTFVIPMDMMVECIDLRHYETQGSVVSLRGEPLPYVRLREAFGLAPAEAERESLVVVRYGRKQRAGLVVDKLLGEFQTVIKPLGVLFDKVGGLSGSTILGDGRVALILDVPQLIQRAAMANAVHAAADGDA